MSDPTKTWCRRVIHITQFLSTWAQFNSMGGHGWAHIMLWMGMGEHMVADDGYGMGMGSDSKENVGLC